MTDRQIKKELERQAVLFEEKVKNGTVADATIRFADFADKYMAEYAQLYLKPKTVRTYTENLVRIKQAIGHIRLCDLRTGHINSFYRNLQESGVRNRVTAVCKLDLRAQIGTHRGALAAFSRSSGVSRATINQAVAGKPISKKSAEAIAAALGMKLTKAFTVTAHGEPMAPASVLSYHRTLSSILTRAVKWKYLQTNPADNAEKPALGRREAAYLEEADARRLLELLQAEPIRWRAVITFDLLSGLRRAELLGLRWKDVDLDAHTITIRQTSNYLSGVGVYVSTPKSESSARAAADFHGGGDDTAGVSALAGCPAGEAGGRLEGPGRPGVHLGHRRTAFPGQRNTVVHRLCGPQPTPEGDRPQLAPHLRFPDDRRRGPAGGRIEAAGPRPDLHHGQHLRPRHSLCPSESHADLRPLQ